MTAPTACAFQRDGHHSDDRVNVWHGAPEPVTLCGWHASPAWLFDALNAVSREANLAAWAAAE